MDGWQELGGVGLPCLGMQHPRHAALQRHFLARPPDSPLTDSGALSYMEQDDQDYVLGSTDAKWMPSLDKYLRKQGETRRAVCIRAGLPQV